MCGFLFEYVRQHLLLKLLSALSPDFLSPVFILENVSFFDIYLSKIFERLESSGVNSVRKMLFDEQRR